MIWSISTYREFRKCQRKWFYKNKIAHWSKKNKDRREVFILSNLVSISAWRGQIVDYTISNFMIPKILKNTNYSLNEVINYAKKLTSSRYEFAKNKSYRNDSITKSKSEYEYSALFPFEYNTNNNLKESFKIAWDEISTALTNIYNNKLLLSDIGKADYLIAQRSLTYKKHGFSIRAVPDLIAFYNDKPPTIIDWKVHVFATKSYNEQLLLYAIALKNCKPHKDFPDNINSFNLLNTRLQEYQLLTNSLREYQITSEYINEINEYITDGLLDMQRRGCHKNYSELSIDDFDVTHNPQHCKTCNFKKICWVS